MASSTAVFRAVADFASLNRAVKGSRREIAALKADLAAVNKNSENLDKSFDRLAKSQESAAKSSKNLASAQTNLNKALKDAGTAAEKFGNQSSTAHKKVRSEVDQTSKSLANLVKAEKAATTAAVNHTKALDNERKTASAKSTVLKRLSDSISKTAEAEKAAASGARSHATALDRESGAARIATKDKRDLTKATKDSGKTSAESTAEHDALARAMGRLAPAVDAARTSLDKHSTSVSSTSQSAHDAAAGQDALARAMGKLAPEADGSSLAMRNLKQAIADANAETSKGRGGLSSFVSGLAGFSSSSGRAMSAGQGLKSLLIGLIPAGLAPAITLVVGSLVSLAGGLVGIVGAAGPLVGVLGAIPTALLSMGGALATVKIATMGMDKAFKSLGKAMSGGPKEMAAFNKEIAKLPAPAQNFMRSLIALKPAITQLRTAAQGALFPGLTTAVNTLAPMIKSVAIPAVTAFGAALGGLAVQAAKAISGLGPQLTSLFTGTGPKLVSTFGQALINLGVAFVNVATAAAPFTQWLADLGVKFSEFLVNITSGEAGAQRMQSFFEKTQATLTTFGHAIAAVGGILRSVFSAATPLGQHLLDQFVALAEKTEAWMKSAEGKNALADYFTKLQPNIDIILRLFGKLAMAIINVGASPALTQMLQLIETQLVPAVERFSTALSNASKSIGPQIIQLFTTIVDILTRLVTLGADTFFQTFVSVLQGLATALLFLVNIPGVGEFVAILLALAAAMKAIKAVGAITGLNKLGRSVNQAVGAAGRDKGAKTALGGLARGVTGKTTPPAQTGTARVGQAAGEKVRSAGTAVAGFFKASDADKANKSMSELSKTAAKVKTDYTTGAAAATAFGQRATASAQQAGDSLANKVVTSIANTTKKLDTVPAAFDKMGAKVATGLTKTGTAISNFATAPLASVGKATDGLGDKMVSGLSKAGTGFDSFSTKAVNAASKVGTSFDNVSKNIGSGAFSKAFDNLGSKAVSGLQKAGAGFDSFSGKVVDGIGKAATSVDSLGGKILTGVSKASSGMDSLGNGIVTAGQKVGKGVDAIGKTILNLPNTFKTAASSVGTALAGIPAKVSSTFSAIGNTVKTLGTSISTGLTAGIQKIPAIITPIGGLFTKMAAPIAGVVNSVKGLGTTFSGLKGAFSTAAASMTAVNTAVKGMEGNVPILTQMKTAFQTASSSAGAFKGVSGTIAAAGVGIKGALGGIMAALGGPWGIAIAGAVTVLGLLAGAQDRAAASAAAQQQKVDALKGSLDQYTGAVTAATTAQTAQEIAGRKLSDGTTTFASALQSAGISFNDYTAAASGNEGALQKVNAQLAASASQMPKVQQLYQQWKPYLDQAGVSMETFVAAALGNVEAQNQVGEAAKRGGLSMASWQQELSRAVGPVGELGSALGAYNATLKDAQTQQQLAAGASKNFTATLDSIKAGLAGLAGGAQALPAMVAAFGDLGASAQTAATAAGEAAAKFGGVKAGGDAAAASMQASRDAFIAAAPAAMQASGEAAKLADQIGLIPAAASIIFQTNATGTQAQIITLGEQIKGIPLNTVTNIGVIDADATAKLQSFGIQVKQLPNGQSTIVLQDEAARTKFESFVAWSIAQTATVNLVTDTNPAMAGIQGVITFANGSTGTISVDGNAALVEGKIQGAITLADGSTGTIQIDAQQDLADGKVDAVITKADGTTATLTLDAKDLATPILDKIKAAPADKPITITPKDQVTPKLPAIVAPGQKPIAINPQDNTSKLFPGLTAPVQKPVTINPQDKTSPLFPGIVAPAQKPVTIAPKDNTSPLFPKIVEPGQKPVTIAPTDNTSPLFPGIVAPGQKPITIAPTDNTSPLFPGLVAPASKTLTIAPQDQATPVVNALKLPTTSTHTITAVIAPAGVLDLIKTATTSTHTINVTDNATPVITKIKEPTESTHTINVVDNATPVIEKLKEPTSSTHTINVVVTGATVPAAGGGVFAGGGLPDDKDVAHFAPGGVLKGHSPGRDTIPAVLSPGEGVLVPELVQRIGAKNIIKANKVASSRSGSTSASNRASAAGQGPRVDGPPVAGLGRMMDSVANGQRKPAEAAAGGLVLGFKGGGVGKFSRKNVRKYRVRPGDTMDSIAKKNKTSAANIIAVNPSEQVDEAGLKAGQEINVPKKKAATSASVATAKPKSINDIRYKPGTQTAAGTPTADDISKGTYYGSLDWMNADGTQVTSLVAPDDPFEPQTYADLYQWLSETDRINDEQEEFESNVLTIAGWGLDDLAAALAEMGVGDIHESKSITIPGQKAATTADATAQDEPDINYTLRDVSEQKKSGLLLSRDAIGNRALAERMEQELERSKESLHEDLGTVLKIISALQKTAGLGIREVSTATELATTDIFKVMQKPKARSQIENMPIANKSKFLSNLDAYSRGEAFARGGFVPGAGNRDTVPAWLTPGEFVVRKGAAEAIGTQNLSQLNNADRHPIGAPGFAAGGVVPDISDLFNVMGSNMPIRLGKNSGLKKSINDAVKAGTSTTSSTDTKSVVFQEGSVQITNPVPARSTDSFENVMTKLSWAGTFS